MARSILNLLLFASTANAQLLYLLEASDGFYQAGPPWQQNGTDYENLIATYLNATGPFQVPGPDLSKAPDQIGETDVTQWTWTIAISDHLPLDNATVKPKDGPFFYTGGQISLQGFTAANESTDDVEKDWEMCMTYWDPGFLDTAYPDAMRSDNGTCLSVLSTECINDMISAAKPSNKTCVCPQVADMPSCQRLKKDKTALFTGSQCRSVYFDAGDLRQRDQDDDVVARLTFGSGAYDLGNETAYNDFGTKAYPFILNFNTPDGGEDLGSMRCLRSSSGVAGSTEPVPPSAGSHAAGLHLGLMTAVLVVSVAILA